MNKDDFDIFRHLTKAPKNNSAVDLIRGLKDRERGYIKKYVKSKESIQLFAEEQLVRKQDLNEMRCEMPGLPRSTFLMVFSPDGQRAASTHGNHNIYVTDLRSGKNIKTLVGHPRTPWCIAFHPTSDQIVASGCLGGQVRIWDLSGGSEVWTSSMPSVIASIAFHPNDRVLVIATSNEVYFWDWSQPEPFVHAATNNPKEKVRYVAFDKLGHKLITGIANSPQTRWERVRAPVPVPRQERCASPYRRRITQRLVTSPGNLPNSPSTFNPEPPPHEREPTSVVPERERRITMCYRNLVREYELLVHRYLQLYRPPTMIDRGTDPMEPSHYTSGTQTAENVVPGPSGTRSKPNNANLPGPSSEASASSVQHPEASSSSNSQTQPSTSHSQNLITPSRIFSVGRKPPSSIRGTQTSETRKHKAEELNRNNEKRLKRNDSGNPSSESGSSRETSPQNRNRQPQDNSNNGFDDQRVLVVNLERLSPERIPSASMDNSHLDESVNSSRFRASRLKRRVAAPNNTRLNAGVLPSPRLNEESLPGENPERGIPASGNRYSERFNEYIRSNRERIAEFHRRNPSLLSTEEGSDGTSHDNQEIGVAVASPTLSVDSERLDLSSNTEREQRPESASSNPSNQRNVEELLSNIRRTAEEEVRNRILPIIRSVPPPDRPELIRLFENSREHVRMRFRQMCPVFLRRHCRRTLRIDSSTDSSSSDNEHDHSSSSPTRLARRNSEPNGSQQSNNVPPNSGTAETAASSNASTSTPNVSMSSGGPTRTTERNFNTELEQLVTSLLTEIERNENEGNLSNTFSQTSANNGQPSAGYSNDFFGSTTSARTRPSWSNSERIPQPPGESIENILSDDYYREQRREEELYHPFQPEFHVPTSSAPPHISLMVPSSDPRNSYLNTSTRTTNSTIYTSNSNPTQRRRFFSHRVSAFMPTRVNYTRTRFRRNPHYTWGSGRAGIPRTYRTPSLVLDELINYAERENSEDDLPTNFHPFNPPPEFPSINPENIGIGNMYSNIVQDLESSLNDVRNIRASNRPGETSDMLSSFSERLENIMTQSDTILRNLRSSMDLLPSTEAGRVPDSEPRWNFNDPGFYVRDLRNEPSTSLDVGSSNDSSLQSLIGSLHAVATDHTYPRNPNNSGTNDNMSPLMNSLHLTISHIQRQARLLRRQVESIERIDRAMVEVAQLQLMRQLVIELVRHVRSISGESRSTGVSSVRQMMAGTRISDSSPYESPNEESAGTRSGQQGGNDHQPQPGTSLGTASSSDQPSTSTNSAQQRRSTNRKTYPPSRFVRMARHYQRRPSIVHWFSRRYLNRFERGIRQNQQARSGGTRTTAGTVASNVGSQIFNYSNINSSTLSLMTRRLEHLLTDQMRTFTRPQEATAPPRSTASVDLGEHILALRLHGCLLRMNRVLGNSIESSTLRNLRSDATAAVTQDGAPRYGARHTLSLIVDGMSRHIEELGTSSISNSMRMQIHGVLAMSLLLTELLLLQVVDSIPPPSGMNLDPERESLARRIDEMCSQMLQNRVTGGSAQLTRSLRLMRLTMRHAHRALDQTYIARRNAMLPRQDTDRRQLLGTINRCLRTISRTQGRSMPGTSPGQSTNNENASNARPSSSSSNENTEAWYSTINDLITRYSDNREDDMHNQPSTSNSRERAQNRDALSSNNDNSDDDPDDPEPDWFYHRNNNTSSHNSNLYRTSNVNLVAPNEPPNPPRLWNVPSVQVNDIPVSEPSAFAQRLLSHRQRFAERVSELRSNPRVGLFRPRFLHPLYASVNPFDADLDDPQREQIYDSDMITTVTPNHRIQAWDISNWTVPSINNSMKNVVVSECKIHNDASVDIATDGTILVTLLPSGGYLNVTNRLGVYSLRWETLGQCLYTTSFEQNAVSVSLSPLSRHLVVGFASRRVSIVPSDRWVMARIYKIEQKDVPGDRLPVLRELEQHRESRINCIRWLPTSGQGLIYATNTGQLVILS